MGLSSSKHKDSCPLDKSFEKIIVNIKNNGKKGIGFLCKIKSPNSNKLLPVLITTSQLYNKEDFYTKEKIEFTMKNFKYFIFLNNRRKSYVNDDKYDIAILEIKEHDELSINSFLEIESDENFNIDNLYKSESLGLVAYNKKEKNYEAIKFKIKTINQNQYNFKYECDLNEELIGSPIINITNNKIVGIYKDFDKKIKMNNGILLKIPLNDFLEEERQIELFSPKNNNLFKNSKTLKSTIKINDDDKEIGIIYSIPKNLPNLRLFGDDFVKKNKDKCKISLYDAINDKEIEYELCTSLKTDYIKEITNIQESNNYFRVVLKPKEDLTDLSSMFKDCIHLILLDKFYNLNTEKVTSMAGMFEGCTFLLDLKDIMRLNTSFVTDMSFMFKDCAYLTDLDISNWNTSNVKTIKGMFQGCEKLEIIMGLPDLDISNVTDISYLFSSCKGLNDVSDISGWNTGNVTNMEFMFNGCSSLEGLPEISKWNTSKVKNMSSMFNSCITLKSLPDISNWDVSNVNNLSYMFKDCKVIEKFPNLSNWNTSNVEDMTSMFQNCEALKEKPDIQKWNLSNLKSNKDLFEGCNSLSK